jgi:hypothetical protein
LTIYKNVSGTRYLLCEIEVIIRFVEIGGIFMCNIYLMHQGNIKQLFDGSAGQG